MIARAIFVRGPAIATKNSPLIEFLKYAGLICTGLPRPKPITNIIKKPMGSMCAIGFGVSLFCNFGVGSPK